MNDKMMMSREKLSSEVERIRELQQNLASTRFEIAAIKKRIEMKKRNILPSSTSNDDITNNMASTNTSTRRRGGRREAISADVNAYVDTETRRFKQLVNLETRMSEELEIANENLEILVDDFSTFEPSKATTLMSSELPILLFPVKLETKFRTGNHGTKELLIRIYPDKIAVQTHEDELTESEMEAGEMYWRKIWYAGRLNTEKRKEAWGVISSRYGQYRGAWIVCKVEETLKNKDEWPSDAINPSSDDNSSDGINVPRPNFERNTPKPASWTLAPSTHIMPDRWVVITYAGNDIETHRVIGNPIPPDLNVGINPLSEGEDDIGGEGELKVDDGIKWLVDFYAAEAKGMAVRVKLDPGEEFFTRIIAIGLKYSANGVTSTKLVEELFNSHHYTQGLAFVPQGTPTNNTTSSKRSGFSSKDNYLNTYEVEASDTPLYTPTDDPYESTDGDLAAKALGLKPNFFDHTENSDLFEHQDARHMGLALWPSCMGYFLEEMMRPIFTIEDVRLGRRFFIDNVCGRGPFSALRIGNSPYGILPTSSLNKWTTSEQDGRIESLVPRFLSAMYPHWEKAVANKKVPHIGMSNDPDKDLLSVLGTDPSSFEFHARSGLGDDFLENLMNLFGNFQTEKWWQIHHETASYFLKSLGYTGPVWPRILSMTFGKDYKLFLDTVSIPPISETLQLPPIDEGQPNYIEWLRIASIDEIRQRSLLSKNTPNTILYMLLRHSILREYVNTSFRILTQFGTISRKRTQEPELIKMRKNVPNNGNPVHSVFSGLDTVVPQLSLQKDLGKYLHEVTVENPPDEENLRELVELRKSFSYLKNISTAKLERLMAETLDVFSHRLDAWITGLFTARLNKMRRAKSDGIYIGGFGWIENLGTPDPKLAADESTTILDHTRRAIALNERGHKRMLPKPVVSTSNAGFIHAHSLSQAAAAAVLRNASLTHKTNNEQFNINLSSERVRRSLWYLEGIRQGQPIGTLLGYRFERGLHENHKPLELDQYIQPLRDLFPLDPVLNQNQPAGPQEAISARNVVNGLTMLREWKGKAFPFNKLDIASPAEREIVIGAITSELQSLDDIIDAMGDLTLAESVFQMVQGNYTRLAANVDAYSRGERPPEPTAMKTPRSGVRLTHRVMFIIFENHAISNLWGSSKDNPRARAEPLLNEWVAKVLGDPSDIVCKVEYGTSSNQQDKSKIVTLSSLEICPLDFLELSMSIGEQQQSEIDARISYHILSKNPNRKNLKITYDVIPADLQVGQISFANALEFANRLRLFMSSAREIVPDDIIIPEQSSNEIRHIDSDELLSRVQEASDRLDSVNKMLATALATSTEQDLVQALKQASLFVAVGAFPNPPTGSTIEYIENLKRRAEFVKSELEKIYERAQKLQFDGHHDEATKIKIAVEKIKEIFGSSFKILPRFTPPNSAELEASIANFNTLLDGDIDAPIPWFQQATKVRISLSRYEDILAFAEALGRDTLGFRVVQIPFDPDERWAALPFDRDDENAKPRDGKLSLVFSSYGNINFASKIAGLVIDDWTEIIPSNRETTGIAFQYDVPNSEAPQTLLLAVPVDKGRSWQFEDIVATVNETLDLAKIRAVDLDLLGVAGQYLPTLFFTSGAMTDDVSKPGMINTDFARSNTLKSTLMRGDNRS